MTACERVLSCLNDVRQLGPDRWIARCPAHDDGTPSLSIRELADGRILLHDFGGCDTHQVVDAIGLGFSDLYPIRTGRLDHRRKRERRPFSAEDALWAVAHEAKIVMLAASDQAQGKPLSHEDRERLSIASSRLQHALEVIRA